MNHEARKWIKEEEFRLEWWLCSDKSLSHIYLSLLLSINVSKPIAHLSNLYLTDHATMSPPSL